MHIGSEKEMSVSLKDEFIDVLTRIEVRKNILVEKVEGTVLRLRLLMQDVFNVPRH